MCPFVNMGQEFGSTKEAAMAPEGRYNLQIAEVHLEDLNTPKKSIWVSVRITNPPADMPEAYPFRHYINLPKPDSTADQKKGSIRGMKRFLHAFGIAYTGEGFDTDALHNATADDILVKQEPYEKDGKKGISQKMDLMPVPDEHIENYEGRNTGNKRRR